MKFKIFGMIFVFVILVVLYAVFNSANNNADQQPTTSEVQQ